jgi:hypothetical protein
LKESDLKKLNELKAILLGSVNQLLVLTYYALRGSMEQ